MRQNGQSSSNDEVMARMIGVRSVFCREISFRRSTEYNHETLLRHQLSPANSFQGPLSMDLAAEEQIV